MSDASRIAVGGVYCHADEAVEAVSEGLPADDRLTSVSVIAILRHMLERELARMRRDAEGRERLALLEAELSALLVKEYSR
jgi:hypothetical protein